MAASVANASRSDPSIVAGYLPCPLHEESDVRSDAYNCLVVVSNGPDQFGEKLKFLAPTVHSFIKLDKSAAKPGAVLIPVMELPHGRLIYSATGPTNRDQDDVRRYEDAAVAGVKRAVSAGCERILLAVSHDPAYVNAELVTILGALDALYVSAEAKQGGVRPKATRLGLLGDEKTNTGSLLNIACALEASRTVARDIASASPTFLAPPAAANYIFGMLERSPYVKIEIIDDQEKIEKNYPIMSAVNRAVNKIPEFESRLVKLTYTGDGPIEQTLMFVGKGVTFDSGGSDLKVGGAMVGMSHDKGGAAAVAGFFKVLSVLKPKGLKAIASIPLVRNGIGPEGVTCDEIIRSRSGKRMRIVNTDAEGRMIMVDPLCEMVELAKGEVNPHLFTIATLTGHAVIAAGPGYALIMDNGPAKLDGTAQKIKAAGENIADPMDVSSIRREDYDFHYTKSDDEDLLQSYSRPSTQIPRGHQIPAAFLILGSRLDQHGSDSSEPLPYTHIDIAGAEEGEQTKSVAPKSTGSPILALSERYILQQAN